MTGPVYVIFLLTELNSCRMNVIAVWFMFITFLPMPPTVVNPLTPEFFTKFC